MRNQIEEAMDSTDANQRQNRNRNRIVAAIKRSRWFSEYQEHE